MLEETGSEFSRRHKALLQDILTTRVVGAAIKTAVLPTPADQFAAAERTDPVSDGFVPCSLFLTDTLHMLSL